MANNNRVPSPVLALPPLEYDVQYMNNMIRLLNYFIEQQNNPGNIRGSVLELSSGTVVPDVTIDTTSSNSITKVVVLDLPTSASGLVTGQIWRNGSVLNIIP
jgi:molybdopterin-binding protein